jgi:spermidine synthase
MNLPRIFTALACTTLAFVPIAIAKPVPADKATAKQAACGTENLIAGKSPWQQRDLIGNPALITDGNATAEGALWEGPAGVRLEGGSASITYDLGKPTPVSALYLQADANDIYRITASLDGQPGTFKLIWQAANASDRGHGMRTRSIQIEPATVRYLRVGEAEGDNAFSISEFAAYCKPPTPFPPNMQFVEAPMAVGPKPAGETPTEDQAGKPSRPLGSFEIVLGVVILLLTALTFRRRQAGAPTASAATAEGAPAAEGVPAAEGAPAAESAPAQPLPAAAPAAAGASNAERLFPLVLLLFLGSGCAALMYEIIWFQLLQLVLGSSAVSIAVLLGTFMAGMCIGSLALARYVSPAKHPLRVYAVLELAIGASGLLMLVAMPLVQGVYTTVVGHGVPGLLLRGFFAAICLLPPTVMMGATLPAVARWVQTTPRGVSWLGYFYGGNTIGAVFGCLLAGFYLLRVHDMNFATFVAVALNVVVASAAIALARLEPRVAPSDAPPSTTARVLGAAPPGAWAVYLTIALSGLTALGAEVIWTRLFSLLLSGTTYTFSIILAVFLIGIGIGSAAGSFLSRRTPDPRRALGIAQVALIAAILWTAWNITNALPYWPVNPRLAASPWFQFQIDLVRCLWTILPAALLWGASFPLALASVASAGQDGGVVVGRVYAANTVGAIVGALATSLITIAAFGTQNGTRIMIVLAAIGAIAVTVPTFVGRAGKPQLSLSGLLIALVIIEIAAVAARNVPAVPSLLVGHGRFSAVERNQGEKYLYVGEGMNSSPAVSRDPAGILSYHNAGKVQASSQPQDMRLQRMLGHLTTLVPERPSSVLVIACGAGVTAGAASIDPRVEKLTIAEIEPLVPTVVAKYFGDHNYNVVKNPKVRVEVDDARHFLNTTKEKFDAITSDPFDPWVKGAATLYTKEFWELAKSHLKPGGIVTVFVQLYDSGMPAVKSEVATFFQVFPDGIVWGNTVRGEGYDIVLSGQVGPATRINVDAMEQRLASPEYAQVAVSLRQIGFDSATALLSTYGGRGAELGPWLHDAEINRDKNLRLQFLAGFGMNVDQRAEIYRGMLAFRRYPEDLFAGSPQKLAGLRSAILARQ